MNPEYSRHLRILLQVWFGLVKKPSFNVEVIKNDLEPIDWHVEFTTIQ